MTGWTILATAFACVSGIMVFLVIIANRAESIHTSLHLLDKKLFKLQRRRPDQNQESVEVVEA